MVIAAFGGEFGWELCTGIPYLRAIDRGDTVVVCRCRNRYFYEDFAIGFIYHDWKGKPDRWLYDWKKKVYFPDKVKDIYKGCKFIAVGEKECLSKKKKWFKYGDPVKKYDLIIHARNIKRYDQTIRNYNPEKYAKIVATLRVKAACIGTGSHYIEGTDDLRDIDSRELCNYLSGAKVCLGTSSGPMHLASLCGCPHVVITGNEYRKAINGTNRDRYKKLWNPFETPCKVLDKHKWNPPVKTVLKAVEKYL